MLKLVFWLIISVGIYLWYSGRKALAAEKEAELKARQQARPDTIDVEAEVIETDKDTP